MDCTHDYGSSLRRHSLVEGCSYLSRQMLLHLKPLCEELNDLGDLGETYNSSVWYIGNRALPIEGQQMVFAH